MDKETLIQYIEILTPEQIELLGDIIKYGHGYDRKDKLKVCGIGDEEWRKMDNDYPSPYADRIREIYPDFIKSDCVYDYNVERYGSMVNLNNRFAQNIIDVFKRNPVV